ncbi:MAG: rod shape-determining protein MreC [Sandaracinaceae bacterium]|nr:rod shape-determining protein MreC [Sandaracinaceae bacterium]
MSYLRRLRDAAISVLLLVFPFLVLKASLSDPANYNAIDSFVLRLSAPIQGLATQAAAAVSGPLEEYFYLVDVKAENERLARENARHRQELRTLRALGRENNRLKRLLGLREQLGRDVIAARVIAKDVYPSFRVTRVVVDRGDLDRIRPRMPVVSSDGLVGQIRRTFGTYADVTLTVDRSSAIDVVVRRTGARGVLRGTGDKNRYACRIQYHKRSDEVEVGDEVYTSGYGRRFPSSILIGRVSKVDSEDYGLYQTVEVTPSVDFSRLEEVLILGAGAADERENIRRRGNE